MPVEQEGAPVVRLATPEDVPMLDALIAASVHRLQLADYSEAQRDGALGSVFGVDGRLIDDRTYSVAIVGSRICACGGWSRRATPFGSDRSPARDDRILDPEHDAAKIRAVFVDPSHARAGLGTLLLKECEAAARSAGFKRAELTATLTGAKLFRVRGYVAAEEIALRLENGEMLPLLRMVKHLE